MSGAGEQFGGFGALVALLPSGEGSADLVDHAVRIWASGGWLMVPLLVLTVFIYATAIHLFCRVHFHFLLRGRVHRLDLRGIARGSDGNLEKARRLVRFEALSADEVRRHFEEVRSEYLPFIDRRIRFLGIIIAAGPLLGLLGTVVGMLSTFSGMLEAMGNRFDSVVTGISEALITTQTGLVIAIPALIILSWIIQRRNSLVLAIARLERYNTRLVLRSDCPIPASARAGTRGRL